MTVVIASAPGKIVLSGEYAVLFGAPAIVTAVDCRAEVSVEAIDGNDSVLYAPGMQNENVRFRREANGDYRWTAGRYRLVEEVIEALAPTVIPAFSCSLDTRAFRDERSGRKLGFGSSAALATALTAALDSTLNLHSDIPSIAASAHWAYQSGTGSGVDIAASVNGGTLRFEKKDAREPRTLNWPTGLEYRILWSGHPANTTQILRNLDLRQAGSSTSGRKLVDAAVIVASSWESGSLNNVLPALREYVADLVEFSTDHEIGIFAAGHMELLEPAADLGLVYKPCGAGGGDIGVVFGGDRQALDDFSKCAVDKGFALIDIAVSAPGISINRRPDS